MSTKSVIEPNAIYTREEATEVMGVSLSTLKQLIRAGHLVVSQPLGMRRVFIKGSSILNMLDKTTVVKANPIESQFQAPPIPASTPHVDRERLQAQIWQKENSNNLASRSKSIAREGKPVRLRGGAHR